MNEIINQVKKIFIFIMDFLYDFIPNTKKLFRTPYKNLTWPKKILKTGMILFGILMVIVLGKIFILLIAMTVMIIAATIGLNDGVKESVSRSRRRRY